MNIYYVGTVTLLAFLLYKLYFILPARIGGGYDYHKEAIPNPSLMVLLGSGGHTKEMILLMKELLVHHPIQQVDVVIGEDDQHSLSMWQKDMDELDREYRYHKIPRSRKVNQSYRSSIFTTLSAFLYTTSLCFQLKPNLFISNGPGTSIPIYASLLLMKMLRYPIYLVYVESLARVKDLSLTGKITYFFADRFIVQWEQLITSYPSSSYAGRLV